MSGSGFFVSFAVFYLVVCQAACFERRKHGAGGGGGGGKSAGVFKPQTKMEREFHEMKSYIGTRPDLHFVPRWNISHVLSLQA